MTPYIIYRIDRNDSEYKSSTSATASLKLMPSISMLEVLSKISSPILTVDLDENSTSTLQAPAKFIQPTTPPPSPVPYTNDSPILQHRFFLHKSYS